jgi:hypothetical protein
MLKADPIVLASPIDKNEFVLGPDRRQAGKSFLIWRPAAGRRALGAILLKLRTLLNF